MGRAQRTLTDDEGTFLALLLRAQPTTAYQLSKIYADSPVSNFGTSKGKIYPLIRRLTAQGLIDAQRTARGSRFTETLGCSASGEKAVREWVLELKPEHLLPEDPLRTKAQSFDLLSRAEQIEWIAQARAGLQAKLDELAAYAETVSVPFQASIHDNAVSTVRMRLEWLDRLLVRVMSTKA